MTKPARILVAAVAITLIGTLPALSGPRIKPRIPLPSTDSAQSSSSSPTPAASYRQESSTSRQFKDGLVSGIGLPAGDGAAKSAESTTSWSSTSHSH